MTRVRIFSVALFVSLIACLNAPLALAAGGVCNTPVGNEGDLIYNDDYDIVQYCAGSNIWIKLGGGTVDARIGTLQNSKWCATNASGVIQCDQNAPSGVVGADKQVQFNNSNAMAGATKLIWDESAGALAVGTSSAAAASSVLELDSTAKGFLPPRMTTAQRDAISSPATGLMIFNSTNGQIELYTGSAWTGLGGLTTGAIAAFASATCPTGWSEYTPARGRFLRGIDNGAGNDPSGTRTPGNIQTDMVGPHTHQAGRNFHFNDTTGSSEPQLADGTRFAHSSGDFSTLANSGVETRPKNVAVIFCQYNGVGNVPATATVNGTANYVAKFTGATNLGNSQIYDSGTNIGIGTTAPGYPLHVKGSAIGEIRLEGTTYAKTSFNVSSAGSDQKRWQAYAYNGGLTYSALNDAENAETPYMTVTRGTGTAITGVNFPNGNVGIGTSTPGAPLDVEATGSSVRLAQFLAPNQGNGLLSQIVVGKDTTTNYAQGALTYTYNSTTPATSYISLGNATVNSAMLNVLGNGYVGIGTASPQRKLDIDNGLTSAGNGSVRVVGYQPAFEVFNRSGSANWYFGNNDADNNALYIGRGYGPAQGLSPNIVISQTGNVYIGTTTGSGVNGELVRILTPQDGLRIDVNHGGGSGAGLMINRQSSAGSSVIFYYGGSSVVGSIYTNSSSTTYNTSSDKRLKENIRDSSTGLDALMRLPVREFNFIGDKEKKTVHGFVAQELIHVFPEAVTTNGDDGTAPLANGKQGWSVDYGRITPMIVKAVQELKSGDDALRTELKAANDNNKAQSLAIEELRAEINALKRAAH